MPNKPIEMFKIRQVLSLFASILGLIIPAFMFKFSIIQRLNTKRVRPKIK